METTTANFLVWKNNKKRHISKTTKNWAVIIGGKIRNLWNYSDRTDKQGWELQILRKKIYMFSEIFLKKSQKTYIWKTAGNWTVIIGGKTCNSLEYSDSAQLQGWELQVFKIILLFEISDDFWKNHKNVISRKLEKTEQSKLEAGVAILEITLTGPNYRVGYFRFCKKKLM